MSAAMKKKLPVGIENFAEIRTEDFYYIDKTALIADLLHNWGKVNLFTRPRRFGKSLNMSMLRTFFEIGCNKALFENLNISKEKDLCEQYQGKFPVIAISLKDVNGENFDTARSMMCSIIGSEAMRFELLSQSKRLSEMEKARFQALIHVGAEGNFEMSDEMLMNALFTLCSLLHKHYDTKVIVLIDEYDVPLAKANDGGYYDQMVSLIRNMFSRGLKTNDFLYFAVLTGCLRVAKESIFTGMNNLKVLSVADVRFDKYFGFMDWEVREILKYYGLTEAYTSVKEWYDGYRFGNVDVYCPWDVISYCDELRADSTVVPQNYWSNTSNNDIVRHFVEKADTGTMKREIERLIAGETVLKEVRQELTYKELYDSVDNIWSVLFTTGYLTQRGKVMGDRFELAIPNMEIRKIFTRQIMELFKSNVQKDGKTLQVFCEALKKGDAKKVEEQFTEYLKRTISIRDTFVKKPTKENFYHGILLGILGFKDTWGVVSNGEAGEGYSDIRVEIDEEEIGIVIEVKYAQDTELDAQCRRALKQIEENGYADRLRAEGMKTVLKYGIACCKKRCKVLIGD
ncbi:AAA family ATPase [Roseburia hominis]